MPPEPLSSTLDEHLVDALQTLAGKHPGFRPVHAKGIVCSGTFIATPHRWEPEAGEAHLTREDTVKREPGFLRSELAQRLATGPAFFRLLLQLAAEGDPTDDATSIWPKDRPVARLGRLQVDAISPTSQDDERQLLFDPSRVPDGLDLSMDPILLARPHAYALDVGRRNTPRST